MLAHSLARRKAVVVSLVLCGLVFLSLASVANAQSGCGGLACVDVSNFDSNINGWNVLNNQTVIEWRDVQTQTASVWQWNPPGFVNQVTSGNGVLRAYFLGNPMESGLDSNGARFQKTINFSSAGTYRVIMRAAHETGQSAFINVIFPDVGGQTNTGLAADRIVVAQGFDVYQSDDFQVKWPTAASLEVFVTADWPPEYFYLDYIWVVKVSNAYTPVPAGTATPAPMATQLPLPTPFCQSNPGSSPTPPAPNYYLTPVTPEPSFTLAANEFAILDTFTGNFGKDWRMMPGMGIGQMGWDEFHNHSLQLGPGSVKLQFEGTGSLTPTKALVYAFSTPVTQTLYLDGWAMSDGVPAGATAAVEVWTQRSDTLEWESGATFNISHFNWYPFHAVLSPGPGIQAIAIIAHRDDNNSTNFIYLDDLFLYNNEDAAPYCDGTYGYFITRQTINNALNNYGNNETNYTIVYPANKDCPKAILEPNNFWGGILSQLTVWLDEMFAYAPAHTPGSLPELFRTVVLSPVGTIFVFLAILFDWTVPLNMLYIWAAVNIAYRFFLVLRLLKNLIPGA